MKKLISSIRFKLFVIPLVLILVAIGAVGLITSNVTKDSLLTQMEENGYARSIDFIDQIDADGADLETIQARLERITASDDIAYALFISPDLEGIAHSNLDRIGMTFDDEGTKRAVLEGIPQANNLYYEAEDMDVLDINYPAVINGEPAGAVSIGYSLESTNAAIARSIRASGFSALFAVIVIGSILFFTSNNAIGILNQAGGHLDRMATGDFSLAVPDIMLARKDEFGGIALAMNRMQESIVNAVKSIVSASDQLAASSQELTATSEQSAVAADEVAEVVQEIATGSSEQAQATGSGTSSVLELGDLVTTNKEDLNTLNKTTLYAEKLKDQGIAIVNELIESTKVNTSSSEEIRDIIIETNDSAQDIVRASEMIRDIADQTNLLALNASIEAARAGEAGRGFAVVAQEIEALANQSGEFTRDIGNIISELTAKTTRAVATMEEVAKVTESQSDSVNLTNDRFAGIAEAIDDIKMVFENVDSSSDVMSDKNDQLISVMEQLSAISQQNAAGTQEASASVEEQSATVEEVANASEELARLAEELNTEMDYFTI